MLTRGRTALFSAQRICWIGSRFGPAIQPRALLSLPAPRRRSSAGAFIACGWVRESHSAWEVLNKGGESWRLETIEAGAIGRRQGKVQQAAGGGWRVRDRRPVCRRGQIRRSVERQRGRPLRPAQGEAARGEA